MTTLNDWAAAVKSGHSGATAPDYKVQGTRWLDTSVAGEITARLYDGASSVALFKVTTSTHALTVYGAGGSVAGAVQYRGANGEFLGDATKLFFDPATGRLAIGTATPEASAAFQVNSTSRGFLGPRQTTAQREAIVSPAEGLVVYDTDEKALFTFNGTEWEKVGTGGGAADPIGKIIAWPASAVPSGYLECDGSAISRATYADLFAIIGTLYGAGDGSTTFNLPDLRGEVIRGFDNGRGVDSGRLLGSAQLDAFQGHRQARLVSNVNINVGGGGSYLGETASAAGNTTDASSSETIGDPISDGVNGTPRTASETRMRNVAMKYCIKYADAVYTGATVPVLPDATTEAKGAIEIATLAEAKGLAETAKAVVPAQLGWLRAPDLVLENQQASGTSGGSTTSGAWQAYPLNTEVKDDLGSVLSSGEFTLPAGSYYLRGWSVFSLSNDAKLRLYNVTDAGVVTGVRGASAYSNTAHAFNIPGFIEGEFTLAAEKTLRLEYWVLSSRSTDGLGYRANSGETEVFGNLSFWRVA